MIRPRLALAIVLLLGVPVVGQQVGGQDLDGVLDRADKQFAEAKAGYEEARAKSSTALFVEAAFKLEEARIKYLVLQEIGSAEKQKTAAERLRAVNQLSRLIQDGKGGAPPAKPTDVDSKRIPIPDPARQRETEKQVRDLFKEEYARKSAADRKKLARELLEQASRSQDDPVAMWVLYREAQDLSAMACDIPMLVESLDAAARHFEVDPASAKAGALAAAGKVAKSPEEFGALAEALLGVIDDLTAADQYDAAEKASTSALQYARKTTDAGLVARATTRSKETTEAKSLHQSMKGVLQTLAKSPDDPAANLEVGQFLCTVKGAWDVGIRFLTKGSDPALKALAEKELARPTQTPDVMAVADGWWDLAEKEKSTLRKSQLLLHAKGLYDTVPADASALVRAKIAKRLAGIPQTGAALPYVDLLPLINLKKDVYCGNWRIEGGKLISPVVQKEARLDHLRIPYMPPPEYDLRVVVEWKGEIGPFSQSLDFGLVGPSGHFDLVIDAAAGGIHVNAVDDKWYETEYREKVFFAANKPRSFVISVRRTGFSVSLDGSVVAKWIGDTTKLKNTVFAYAYGPVTDIRSFSVSSWVSYHISRLELVPVSGAGKPTER